MSQMSDNLSSNEPDISDRVSRHGGAGIGEIPRNYPFPGLREIEPYPARIPRPPVPLPFTK